MQCSATCKPTEQLQLLMCLFKHRSVYTQAKAGRCASRNTKSRDHPAVTELSRSYTRYDKIGVVSLDQLRLPSRRASSRHVHLVFDQLLS